MNAAWTDSRHDVFIIGGGSAGITVAARLRRGGAVDDVAVVEPSDQHYYQPLWTLVGGGASADITGAARGRPHPQGSDLRDRAVDVDPETRTVRTDGGRQIGYDYLVMAPGLPLDWDKISGLTETLGRNRVSSDYRFDLAPRTSSSCPP